MNKQLEKPKKLGGVIVPEVDTVETVLPKLDSLSTVAPTPRSRNSWLKTVGKYSEDSILNQVLDEGYRLRKSERD